MKKRDLADLAITAVNVFAGRYASAAAGAARQWKTIGGILTFFFAALIILISLLVSLPGLIMQAWLPGEEHYQEMSIFASDEIITADAEKKGFIQWVLDSLSEKDEEGNEKTAVKSGTEPSSDEIQILYAVKYGDYMSNAGLDKDNIQTVTNAFLKRSFLHLELLPFSEAVKRLDLTNEQQTIAINMYDSYMYDQIILNGNGVDIAGIRDFGSISFQDGATEVIYYNQRDKRWSSLAYGDGTIGGAGCGPTSLAMAISSLTSKTVSPVDMSSWAARNGYKHKGGGSYWSLIPDAAREFGLKVEGDVTEAQKLVDALADGKLVIAIMGKGHFTSGGHFLLLRGVTSDGNILVADSASERKSRRQWDISIILNEAKHGNSAGGPFWILSK